MTELTTDYTSLIDNAVEEVLADRDVVRAAGGVVYRTDGKSGSLEVVLIHRPAYDDWSLPKGKLKDGETLEAAALREVQEETGMRCLIARSLGTLDYTDRRGREKVVWYWLMRAIGGTFKPIPEVDRMKWMDFDSALKKLSYDHDRDLLLRSGLQ
jgi:8-oxo-dGTP diphosphatase